MQPWIEYRRHTGWRPLPVTRMTVDPNVLDLSLADRAVFMLLWMVTDDAGRFSAHPRELATRIGWTEGSRKLSSALRRLEATGYVRLYEVDGQQFGELADYAESAKLNNRQPGVYPTPVEPQGEAHPETHPEARPEAHMKPSAEPRKKKEERRKTEEKQKKSSSSSGPENARVRAHMSADAPARATRLQTSLQTNLATEIAWPSASIAMAVRQWRGKLEAYQAGQHSIQHVTDSAILKLVEKFGSDAFESAVVRHVSEDVSKGRWTLPFESLTTRCQWALDQQALGAAVDRVERVSRAGGRQADIAQVKVAAPDVEIVGQVPEWWPSLMDDLRAEVPSGSDWLTWVSPITAVVNESGVAVLCPDGAHAEMVREVYGPKIVHLVRGHTAAPVVFAGAYGLDKAVAA